MANKAGLLSIFLYVVLGYSTPAMADGIDANSYVIYEFDNGNNSVTLYIVPIYKITLLSGNIITPIAHELDPTLPGYTLDVYDDGSFGITGETSLTALQIEQLPDFTLSDYKLYSGDFDNNNQQDLLIQGLGINHSAILTADAGVLSIYYDFGTSLDQLLVAVNVADHNGDGVDDIIVTDTGGYEYAFLNTPHAFNFESYFPGGLLWTTPVAGNSGSSITMKTNGSRFYVASFNGAIKAIDTSQQVVWEIKTADEIGATIALSSDEKTLYVADMAGHVYAIDTDDGAVVWNIQTGDSIYASPAIGSDGNVYIASYDGFVYALDSQTGEILWDYDTEAAIGASPAIDNSGILYVGNAEGYVFAIDTDIHAVNRLRWSHLIDSGYGNSSPIIDGATLYVGSFNNRLYALDTGDNPAARQKWVSADLGGRIAASPAIAPNGLIVIPSFDNGKIWALNAERGTVTWSFSTENKVFSSPAIGRDGTVYVGALDSEFYALNSNSGQRLRWSYSTDSPIIASPLLEADGKVIFASSAGYVYSLTAQQNGVTDSPWSMFRKTAQRRGH